MDDSGGPPRTRDACRGGDIMDFEKYTERSRGFIQSAQSLALREGHQRFSPDHLLKVLLDDEEGLAARFDPCRGGRSQARTSGNRSRDRQDAEGFRRRCRASLSCAGNGARIRSGAETRREGRRQLCDRRAIAAGLGHRAERCLQDPEIGRRYAPGAQSGHQRHPKRPDRRFGFSRAGLRRAEEIFSRSDRSGPPGQARSGHRAR